jgi:hypothetical protein
MRLASALGVTAMGILGAACASRMETHPVEQYAVVHAAMVSEDCAVNAAGGDGHCLLAVTYYSRRTDEPVSGPPLLERMVGLRAAGDGAWCAPSFEADEAFRTAGFRRVSSPKMLAIPGAEASLFVGETIRIPRAAAATAQTGRVGFETTARSEPTPKGGMRLTVDARSMTLPSEDVRQPVTVVANAAQLDLPAGYAVILRLDPTDGTR